ncbi:DNA-binding protein [bacterium]|nr:DNA-binding protein [bacterium]
MSAEVISLFENLITMDDLLELLRHQYSRYTIYRWVERYEMPHKRIRGKLWFPKTEVIQWLERSS